jgi:hypothetical protein
MEGNTLREDDEKDVRSYWMALRLREDTGIWNRHHQFSLCGELTSEEATDLSWRRLRHEWTLRPPPDHLKIQFQYGNRKEISWYCKRRNGTGHVSQRHTLRTARNGSTTSVCGWRKSTSKRLCTKRWYYSSIYLVRFRVNTTGIIQEITFFDRTLTPGDLPNMKQQHAGRCQVIRNMKLLPMSDELSRRSSFLGYLDLAKFQLKILITWQKILCPPAQALQSLVDLGLQYSPYWQALR